MMKSDQRNKFKALIQFHYSMHLPWDKFHYHEDYANWAADSCVEWVNKSKKTKNFSSYREYVKSYFVDMMEENTERVNKYATMSADLFDVWISSYNVKIERI